MSVPSRYVQKWAPCEMTPSRNAWPWTRLPTSRPCMSVMATTIVSIWPSRTISSSSRRRRCLVAWPASWSLIVGLPLIRSTCEIRVGIAVPAGDSRETPEYARVVPASARQRDTHRSVVQEDLDDGFGVDGLARRRAATRPGLRPGTPAGDEDVLQLRRVVHDHLDPVRLPDP